MANLTTKARKSLPKKDFALPGSRSYPVEDKAHAVNAKARASQAVNAGRMSESTKSKIDAKANKVIKAAKKKWLSGITGGIDCLMVFSKSGISGGKR